jgi:hypothetical protein
VQFYVVEAFVWQPGLALKPRFLAKNEGDAY